MNKQWFTNFQRPTDAPLRLFCFPYAGGGANIYREWARLLDNVEVVAAQLPGRERRIMEPPIDGMPDLTANLVRSIEPLLDKPFFLFGHSMGALIAYELASQLQQRGAPTPRHVFLSAYRSPDRASRNKQLHMLSDTEFMAELRRYGGTPDELLRNPEARELFLPMLRADFKLHETHIFHPRPPLRCPITTLAGTYDRIVSAAEMGGWMEKTACSCSQTTIEGDHFFLHESRSKVLLLLQSYINGYIQDELLATAF